MKIETKIKLNKFQPRTYQKPLFNAMENKGIKKAVLVWHRRAGKDLCCLNLVLRQALKRVGSYMYILPTHRMARLTIWESATNEGIRFLDFIPEELIAQKNIADMRITLVNGSIIYFLGSDNPDRLRGTNAVGVVFSEYAFQNDVYPVIRPILAANDGFVIFISTPNGQEEFYKLYQVAKNSDDWYHDMQTVDDTGIVTHEEIERDVELGVMSWDMAAQEYWCSFDRGSRGSFYSLYLQRAELEGRIGEVPWQPAFPVYTFWDLGQRDSTFIIFAQIIGKAVHVIEEYENHSRGLEHYIAVVESKEYKYAKHFAPHDIMVKEYAGGLTRLDKAKQLGLKFEFKTDHRNIRKSAVPYVSIIDGIEAVRTTLPRMWIDRVKCKKLINAIRDYRREWIEKTQTYSDKPVHDRHSHAADALRYMCLALPQCTTKTSAEDLERNYREAMYGTDGKLPSFFRDGVTRY